MSDLLEQPCIKSNNAIKLEHHATDARFTAKRKMASYRACLVKILFILFFALW